MSSDSTPILEDEKKHTATVRARENDVDSLTSAQSIAADPKPTSSLRTSLRKLVHKSDHREQSSDKPEDSRRKSSIADSGPYTLVKDPVTGKEVLHRNPHWPNEDSWKKEKESEGQWAFGSMMGQKQDDFGGTVG